MRVLERSGIAVGILILVALPTALHGWPTTLRGNLFILVVMSAGLALTWWRSHPRVAPVLALGLILLALAIGGGWFPDTAVAIYSLSFAVVALGWSGRAAWLVALCAAAYLVPLYILSEETSWVAVLMFTVPPYAAGTVLRLRRETADQLAMRVEELEEERELFTEIALRHERARIASELHDIVGHAISVMVIQAAAGQRLVDSDPARAKEAFAAISESARQGTEDLERLIKLLSDSADDSFGGPDLSLVDEVVTRAARSGLNVSCRFEGDRDRVAAPVGHMAFRVVQESLTNALRYAPDRRSASSSASMSAVSPCASRTTTRCTATRLWPGPGAAWSDSASASRYSGASSTLGGPTTAGGPSKHASRAAEPPGAKHSPSAAKGVEGAVVFVLGP